VATAAVTPEAVIRARSISSRKIFVRAATAVGRSASMPRSRFGTELQSFKEFSPRQKPGSFNLERVMEAVMTTPGSGR
jgi:hypothetical protein